MKNFTLLYLVVSLAGCTGLVNHKNYPSIEEECQMLGKDSMPCKILDINDWRLDEKEQQMGYIYFFPNTELEQDCNKAKYWFERAAKVNNAEALNNLGMIYSTGCNVDRSFSTAKEYFIKANKYGSKQAKANLGELYREGGHGIDKDYDKAMAWYEQAITDTPARAYNGIASIYIEKEEFEKAYDYIVKAANLGSAESEYNLSYMYYEGIFVNKDEKEATVWFEKTPTLPRSGSRVRISFPAPDSKKALLNGRAFFCV